MLFYSFYLYFCTYSAAVTLAITLKYGQWNHLQNEMAFVISNRYIYVIHLN